jgi:ribonuclease Z
MARRANVNRLVLFHLSDRYQPEEWLEMLQEARQEFPSTSYPPGWKLDVASPRKS